MKHVLTVFILAIFCISTLYSQKSIKGKILDENSEPLIGTSILIKGTSQGTVTDLNGNFTINAPEKSILVISFTGYEQREVSTQEVVSDLIISMRQDQKLLDEVVVTALGISRNKNELPFSAQKVAADDVVRTRDNNIINTLSGKVAGINIKRNNSLGGSSNIVLRGTKSLTGDNQALFVVDGVPIDNTNNNTKNQLTGRLGYDYGSAAADINPDDIADMTVLKGAAASALYGSRANNGVVLITTKRGSKKNGIGVSLNTGFNFSKYDPTTFIKYQKNYGAGYGPYYQDKIGVDENGNDIYYEDEGQGGEYVDNFFLNIDIDGDGKLDRVAPLTEDASYGAKYDPNLLVYQWDAFDPFSPNYQKATPWVAAENGPSTFFQTGIGTSNGVTIDGSNENGYFKLGYTRTTDKGIMPNSKINKDLVNFGASYNLTKNLKAFSSINYTNTVGNGRYGTGYASTNLMTNFRQWWQTNVDIKAQEEAYNRNNSNVTWNWASTDGAGPIYWDNPYWTRFENYENDQRGRYFGNFGLEYQVTNWLKAKGQVSLDKYNESQEERIAVSSIDVPEYRRLDRDFKEINYDLLFTTSRFSFSENIGLSVLAGSNVRKNSIYSIRDVTNGGLIVPGIYSLSNSRSPRTAPIEKLTQLQVNGIFASASFDFIKTVFLDLSIRRDQASSLPKDNNSYLYPAASLGFLFSEYLPKNDIFTFGKLRLNYAEVGNTAPPLTLSDTYNVGLYTLLDITVNATSINGVPLATTSNTKNNSDLKSEKTKSLEFGLETRFLKDRLGLDLTYYDMKSIDQIIAAPVSKSTGYNFKYINAGTITNKGIELQLFFRPIITKNFSWRIDLNWAKNTNKVVDLGPIDNLLLGSFQGGVSINATKGEPYGTIRGEGFTYNDKGQKIVGANGYYVRNPDQIIGNVNPDWIGGITNTLSYGPFDLSFLIDAKKGGDLFSLDLNYGLATGLPEESAGTIRNPISEGGGYIVPGVTADGAVNTKVVDGTAFGVLGYRRNPAENFIYDASFIKLREVNLAYSLPNKLVNKRYFQGASLGLYARNLWIIHKNLPHADPEEGLASGNVQGYQVGAYPATKTLGVNLNIKF